MYSGWPLKSNVISHFHSKLFFDSQTQTNTAVSLRIKISNKIIRVAALPGITIMLNIQASMKKTDKDVAGS